MPTPKILNFGLIAFVFTILNACNPCRNLDCLTSRYDFRFEIVDKISGENLVFGQNSIFEFKEIRLYALMGSDTVYYPTYREEGFGSMNQDTVIAAEIFPPTGVLFLEYPDQSRDTLSLTFSQRDTECCGFITTITSVTRNGTELFEDLIEPIVFSK